MLRNALRVLSVFHDNHCLTISCRDCAAIERNVFERKAILSVSMAWDSMVDRKSSLHKSAYLNHAVLWRLCYNLRSTLESYPMLKMMALRLDASSSMCLVAFTMEIHHGSVRASILYKSRTSLGRFLLSAARLIIFFHMGAAGPSRSRWSRQAWTLSNCISLRSLKNGWFFSWCFTRSPWTLGMSSSSCRQTPACAGGPSKARTRPTAQFLWPDCTWLTHSSEWPADERHLPQRWDESWAWHVSCGEYGEELL